MRIENGNMVIRSAEERDAQTLCGWWNDGKIMAHAGYPDGIGTTVQSVIESVNRDTDQYRCMMLEIDGKPVGEMNYRTVSEKVAEIGIKICSSDDQEIGNGTKFLKMLIGFLFIQMHYDKIVLDTNLLNTRAQHVYEKIGFRKTSVNIDSWKDQLGVPQSSVNYELTKKEYLISK